MRRPLPSGGHGSGSAGGSWLPFRGAGRRRALNAPKEIPHVGGDGQGRRQARRLDADKVHEARQARLRLFPDDEIPRCLARPLQFGTDPAHVGVEVGGREVGQVSACGLAKEGRPVLVHAVVGGVDVMMVGAETHPPGQVDGGVDAETDGLRRRDGVDEMPQGGGG